MRNEPDGSVEVAAAGTPEAIAQLRLTLVAGPPGARVDELRELSPAVVGELPRPFTILK